MALFIALLLLGAFSLSASKLALLPRLPRMIVAATILPFPFLFESSLSAWNINELNQWLYSAGVLRDLCVCVVAQELASFLAGFSLLSDVELGRRPRRWKYLALAPSLLVPVGILYAQAALFNHVVDHSFATLTRATAAGGFLLFFAAGEVLARISRSRTATVLAALHGGYLFVLTAIFLPVVLGERLVRTDFGSIAGRDLAVLAALASVVLVSAAAAHAWRAFRAARRRPIAGDRRSGRFRPVPLFEE